jgi:hypothetical protein
MYILTGMSTLSIRIDEKVKAKAMKILRKKGLDVSTAVNVYLRGVIDEDENSCELCRKYLPDPSSPKGMKLLARWHRESAEALKGPSFNSFQEIMDDAFGNTKTKRARTQKK